MLTILHSRRLILRGLLTQNLGYSSKAQPGIGAGKWSICAIVLMIGWTALASAAERITVCAKYEVEYGWSKGYKVEATFTSGSELNSATRTFDYSALSKYVVIFWDKDEVSIIEMSFPYLGPIGLEGKDQRGRKWEIAKTSFCI